MNKEKASLREPVAPVKNFDGKWGFVDTTGAEIVPCKLNWIEYTEEPGIFVVNHFNGENRTASFILKMDSRKKESGCPFS